MVRKFVRANRRKSGVKALNARLSEMIGTFGKSVYEVKGDFLYQHLAFLQGTDINRAKGLT